MHERRQSARHVCSRTSRRCGTDAPRSPIARRLATSHAHHQGLAFASSRTPEHRRLHRFRQHRDRRQDHPRRALRRRHHSRGIKERGEVVTKIAYADWTRAGEYSRTLTQHAIRLVQRNLTPGGDKNGADINLALDALEMAFTHPHINAYVIVGGDSDFLSLVEKLKQYDKKVFVVGGRAFTSVILQRNCHEFIAYENLDRRAEAGGQGRPPDAAGRRARRSRRRFRSCAARSRSSPTARCRRRPGCSRARCCSSTRRSRSATTAPRRSSTSSRSSPQAGLVQLKHSGRSVMVELNDQLRGEPTRPKAECRLQADATVRRSAPSSPGPATAEPRRSDSAGAPPDRTMTPAWQPPSAHVVLRRASPKRRRRRGVQAGPGTASARRPASDGTARRRRETRGGRPQRRDHGAMADVPAQRQAAAARGGRRVRRTALRFLGAGRARPRLSEGRAGPPRTRSARRAACVSGSGAAARVTETAAVA